MSSSEYDGVGLFLIKELSHSHRVEQVKLFVCAAHQVGISPLEEIIPNSRPHKSAVAGYIYLSVFV
jgi:hypothetical protein